MKQGLWETGRGSLEPMWQMTGATWDRGQTGKEAFDAKLWSDGFIWLLLSLMWCLWWRVWKTVGQG